VKPTKGPTLGTFKEVRDAVTIHANGIAVWPGAGGLRNATPGQTNTGRQEHRWKVGGCGEATDGNPFSVTVNFKEDGTYEAFSGPSDPGLKGTTQFVDGKLRFKDAAGVEVITLYEGDGRRVLRTERDDGSLTAELEPAK
jgi:hypothetical protein